jgi:hypothetical protein
LSNCYKRSGNVIGGHQRLSVLKDLGYTETDCVVVDLDEQREKALNLALNRIQGDWDEGKLSAVLADLEAVSFDVSLTGFDDFEIEKILTEFYSGEAVEDEFDEAKAAKEIHERGAITKNGDVWQLGDHRIICGDPADYESYRKLLGGDKAQLCVTCPPRIVTKEYEAKGTDGWLADMRAVVKNIVRHSNLVCWMAADKTDTKSQFIEPLALYSINLFADYGLRPIWIRVWKKTKKDFKLSPYHLVTNKPVPQYEYIAAYGNGTEDDCGEGEYAFVSAFAGHAHKFVKRLTNDERKRFGYSGIWEIAAGGGIPVELPWRCIKMHSDKHGIVLDPFAAGGTTVIACEQTGRRCFAVHSDAEQADLIVERWERFTGQKAVKL